MLKNRQLKKEAGYQIDFDHIGMIVSKESQKEVWPLIADILLCQSMNIGLSNYERR